jgi:hypothetical protein
LLSAHRIELTLRTVLVGDEVGAGWRRDRRGCNLFDVGTAQAVLDGVRSRADVGSARCQRLDYAAACLSEQTNELFVGHQRETSQEGWGRELAKIARFLAMLWQDGIRTLARQ